MLEQSVSATKLAEMGKCPTLALKEQKSKRGMFFWSKPKRGGKKRKTYSQLRGDYEHWHYEQNAIRYMNGSAALARKHRSFVLKGLFFAGLLGYVFLFFIR